MKAETSKRTTKENEGKKENKKTKEIWNMKTMKNFIKEEDGIGTVEMILILVVLITLVIIFKDQLTALVNDIFSQITSKSSSIY